jgi:hypothetical protein
MIDPPTTDHFTNRRGTFVDGDQVSFEVENQISGGFMWDIYGTLRRVGSERVVRTAQGCVTINKGYDAYVNSIRPVDRAPVPRDKALGRIPPSD